MARWFRYYEDALDDPKVQRLPGELFKAWVNLLSLASRHNGVLPPLSDISFALRKSERDSEKTVAALVAAKLLDKTAAGIEPHNWTGRQYVSDSPNERVKKYRDKRRASGLPILGDYTKFKAALIARDGDRCIYCDANDRLVVDHMVPIVLGGTDAEDNLALACKPCNSGKAGRTPELANMTIRVTTAAKALARYRDNQRDVTVSETPSESEADTETEADTEKRREERAVALAELRDAERGFALFNDAAKRTGWPEAQQISDDRKKLMRARLKDVGGIEGFAIALGKAEASDFLTTTWPNFNLDWMLKPKNFRKLMEGNYDKRIESKPGPARDGIAADFAAAADLLRHKQYRGI